VGNGGVVGTGLFSSPLSVVNADYRILTWKVCARKWSWPLFAWQDWEIHEKLQADIQCCIYTLVMTIIMISTSSY
jgi:hypothetical protein